MRVLFDLNILLDLLLRREPHYTNAAALHAMVEDRRLEGVVGANTVIALAHLLERAIGPEHAGASLRRVLETYEIRSIGRAALEEALTAPPGQYDDAVLFAAAHHGRIDAIVTRNPENFPQGPVQVVRPRELLERERVEQGVGMGNRG